MAYCIFHRNDNTPSLSISKADGRFICFNPSCGASGDLLKLVQYSMKLNEFEALRYIINNSPNEADNLDSEIIGMLKDDEAFDVFDTDILSSLATNLFSDDGKPGLAYMRGRGFNDDTLRSFAVGYSIKQKMVTVPIYSHTSIPVGLVGRSIDAKRFKNSPGLPGSRLFFNLHRAMRASSTGIVVESSFDAMRVHQSGYPNVVATLGGYVSPQKMLLLNKYFDRIILMTDADEAGRKLANQLSAGFSREVSWAIDSHDSVYPHDAKDVGDLTDSEIASLVKNSVPDIEYTMMV